MRRLPAPDMDEQGSEGTSPSFFVSSHSLSNNAAPNPACSAALSDFTSPLHAACSLQGFESKLPLAVSPPTCKEAVEPVKQAEEIVAVLLTHNYNHSFLK